MQLALLRHGIAAEAGPETGWQDAPRALTDDGRDRVAAAAAGMRALDLRFDALLTSPLTRCVQTAQIVGDALGIEPQPVERLAPGCSTDDLAFLLMGFALDAEVLICGHQPDLSLICADLIGGGDVEFKKCGLAIVGLDAPRPNGGVLEAVYPPATLRRLGTTRLTRP